MEFSTLALTLFILSMTVVQVHYCKDSSTVPNKESDIRRRNILQNEYLQKYHPCGRPLLGNVSRCQIYIKHPNCHSFPGKPRHVRLTHHFLNNTRPVLQIEWDVSSTGFSDLWGFQVYLIEVSLFHPMRYYRCTQINSKDSESLFVQFQDLSFGAQYDLRIQSMPPNENDSNMIIKRVRIKEQCQIEEFKVRPICCHFSTVASQVSDHKAEGKKMISINVTWEINCTDDLKELLVKWDPDNPDYSEKCSGQAPLTNVSCSYVILLQGECSTLQLNYTGQIYGITSKQETTKAQGFQFAVLPYPTEISILPTGSYNSTPNLTVIAVVVGTGIVLGLLLVGLVFGILRRRDSPLIRLVNRPVVSESDTEEMLSDPVKVLILHASCCMSCTKVIYCLWDVLDSTSLFDVRLDILSEPKVNENPLRWYELQVKEVSRVLLVTSTLMQMKDQNLETRATTTESDYVSIRCQLNLLRGEFCTTRDTSKYIPVYMDYNGSKEDIPRFLSVCRSYRFSQDLEKVILNLLGISSIRRGSRKPIVQVSSDNHPFNVKRENLEKAIKEAEEFHKQTHNTGNRTNSQENFVV